MNLPARWWRSLKNSFALSRYRRELEGSHLICGPDCLAEALRETGGTFTELTPGSLPGFHLLARFDSELPGGAVTIVETLTRATRFQPGPPGFHVHLYPYGGSGESLWSSEFEPSRLMRGLLRAALMRPARDRTLMEFAQRWLCFDEDEEMDRLPLFELLDGPIEGVCLSLREVRRLRRVRLLEEKPDEVRPEGEIWLRRSSAAAQLLEGQRCSPSRPKTSFLEPFWGAVKKQGDLISIPIFEEADLVVDLGRRQLRTPLPGCPGQVVVPLQQPLNVRHQETEQRGDTKVHEIHHLTLNCDGFQVQYRARFKDYYEGGAVQQELDIEQDRARRVLFRFADLLRDPAGALEAFALVT